MRIPHLLCALILVPAARAQQTNMTLANGGMTILSGTTVVIEGPIIWDLAPTAALVNHGSVDLGTDAQITEPVGSPITGAGTERCELPLDTGATDQQPGGLGLTLTLPPLSGSLLLTRGHVPRNASGQVESIARWYGLEATSLFDVPFNVSFRYDDTELNGLAPDVLSMHSSPSLGGPWADLPTLNEEATRTLTSSLDGAGIYITAFNPDQTTALTFQSTDRAYTVWPTVASSILYVQANSSIGTARIELIETTGKIVTVKSGLNFTGAPISLDISTLPPGCYFIRINATHVERFVKS
ncbi:MAG: T9SS type A sorting domain-containing protein [Flavobacteriales bacterium]|jgi:hypothetical protein